MQYVSAPDRFDDRAPDLCIVEGIACDACAIAVIPKMPMGGVQSVDDEVTAAAMFIRV